MVLVMRAFLSVAPIIFVVIATSLCAAKNDAPAKAADAAAPAGGGAAAAGGAAPAAEGAAPAANPPA
uniref:Lipoprotein n=1 Tax=Ascaris lumbricoides TaxID=6252 RepID=A0A0M3I284_ASCLU